MSRICSPVLSPTKLKAAVDSSGKFSITYLHKVAYEISLAFIVAFSMRMG